MDSQCEDRLEYRSYLLPSTIALHLSEASPISLSNTPMTVDILTQPYLVILSGEQISVYDEGSADNEDSKDSCTYSVRKYFWLDDSSNIDLRLLPYSACLTFMDPMDKDERCKWHVLAREHGLTSTTEGTSSHRILYIMPVGKHKLIQLLCTLIPTPDDILVTAFSKDLWLACHLEGGLLSDYSQSDIKSICESSEKIPKSLLDAHHMRLQVRELGMSICSGSCGRAVDIVHKDHAVLYKIEEYYFGYPIHLASAFGETKIVEHMYTAASMNGIDLMTQLNSQGHNFVEVARNQGKHQCADQLVKILDRMKRISTSPYRPMRHPSPSWQRQQSTTSCHMPVEVYRYRPQKQQLYHRGKNSRRGNRDHPNPYTASGRARNGGGRVLAVNREQIRFIVENEALPREYNYSSSSGRKPRFYRS